MKGYNYLILLSDPLKQTVSLLQDNLLFQEELTDSAL